MQLKLDHINMTVTDLEESVQWYATVFGFEKVEHGVTPDQRPWAIIRNGDSMLCLYQPAHLDAKTDSAIRIAHFGLRIGDKQEWLRKILSQRLEIGYGGVITYPFSESWYVEDPSGHEIEVSYCAGGPLRFKSP